MSMTTGMLDRVAFLLGFLAGSALLALGGCGSDGEAAMIGRSEAPLRPDVTICPPDQAAQGGRCVARSWIEFAPQPVSAARVRDVLDLDGTNLWLVGRGGLILRSEDGGLTTGHVLAGTTDDLIGIDSYDGQHLLVTSAAARVYVSDDGGVHFRASRTGPAGLGKCTYATGAAVCDGGFRYDLRTGAFSKVAPGAGVVRVASTLGLALAPGAGSTLVLRSTDSGRTFAPGPTIPAVATDLWIDRGARLALVGTAAGEVYRTTDGGVSFDRVFSRSDAGAVRVTGVGRAHLFASTVLRVDTEDGPFGVAEIFASSDGGATFNSLAQEVLHPADLGVARSVPLSFGAPDHGLWVGEMLHGVDARGSLAPTGLIDTDRPLGPQELAFLSTARGYALVTTWHANPPGILSSILRTTDGGASFAPVLEIGGPAGPPPFRAFHALTAVDEDHVFVLGSDVRDVAAPDLLFRSNDGGATWQKGPPFPLEALAFDDALHGLRIEGGALLRTEDGGATWEPVTLPGAFSLRAVAFVDVNRALVVGAGGAILASADGGRSFTVQRSGPAGQTLLAVSFGRGGPVGWAVGEGGGGVLLKSEDEGDSWSVVRLPAGSALSIRELRVLSPRTAVARAVDTMGREVLLSTKDGARWTRRTLPAMTQAGLDGMPRGSSSVLRQNGRSLFVATETGIYRHDD